jgi:O-antigen ligase/tetratricopeptide (TPR) repeat protein
MGAVHVPVTVLSAAVALAAGVLTFFGRSVRPWPAPAALLGALSAYSALQAVPLPLGWLAHLEPTTADIWSRASTIIGGAAPGWASLSMDPGASWLEALKWWAYAGLFIAAAGVGARRGASWGAWLLLVSATLVAVVTLAHGLVDASKVYGFYEPRFGGERWHIGPLVNPNNLAGYLNLGALAGLGLLAGEDPPAPRWVLGMCVAVVLATSAISASRGGLGTLVIGVILLALLFRQSRGRLLTPRAYRRAMLPALLAVFGGVVLATIAATRKTLDALLVKDIQKVKALAWAVPMLKAHPWFGVGRGAFQTVFPEYYVAPGDVVYSHPENFVVQWLTEWGLPVGILGLAATAWLLRPRALGYARSTEAAGLFAGLFAVVLQNAVDLSLEIPAVMFAAVCATGVLWGEASSHESRHGHSRARGHSVLLGVVGLGLAVVTCAIGSRTVLEDRDDLIIDFPAHPKDPVSFAAYEGELRAAMHRHPADPYFPRTGALLAWKGGSKSPLPWIQLALERAPTSGRTNFLLALYLAQRGFRDQALMEMRMAADYNTELASRVAALSIKLTRDPALLRRVVPEGLNGAPVLYNLAKVLPDELGRLQDEFLEESTARDPTHADVFLALAKRLLDALSAPDASGLCAGADAGRCSSVVVRSCEALSGLLPDSAEPLILTARLYMATGKPEVAAQRLAAECDHFIDRHRCLRTWLEAAAAAHDTEMAARAAKEVVIDGCSGEHRCATTYTMIGETLTQAGDAAGGLDYYERAAREEPTPGRWHRVGEAATEIGAALVAKGNVADAISYYERAANEDPTATRWRVLAQLKEPHDTPAVDPSGTREGKMLPTDVQEAIQKARAPLGSRRGARP